VIVLGNFIKKSVPLSPPAEKQMVIKPTKFNDLVGFLHLWIVKRELTQD
jgi:hypothetical protein